jgi:hypothetical protein
VGIDEKDESVRPVHHGQFSTGVSWYLPAMLERCLRSLSLLL